MQIKVCGLKEPENILSVESLAPDYMGFIFYGNSPRFVGNLPPKTLSNIATPIHKTAVFVNEGAATVDALIDQYKFDAVQLHGSESPDFCRYYKKKVKVIKAFGVDSMFDFSLLNQYLNKTDFFLFDTKTDTHGGSGKTFDWSALNNYELDVPFFLSGGLSPDNLEEVTKITHPQFYGVDLNSKFEVSPGIKNIEKLKKAFNIIKKAYTHELRS